MFAGFQLRHIAVSATDIALRLGGQRGRPLVDHQHELHGGVLSWWFEAPEDPTVCHIAAVPGVMSMTPQDGGM